MSIMIDLPTAAGISQRVSSFRFDLLSQDLIPIGTLEVDADRPPSIENNINRTVKRTLNGVWYPRNQAVDVNTLADRVKVVMILGGIEYPCGVFTFGDASIARRSNNDWVAADFVDQCILLDQDIEQIDYVPPGYPVATAIEERLRQALITQYDVQNTGATIGNWIVWPVGTPRIDIVNELCALASCYSIHFNNAGVAIAKAVPDMASSEPGFIYGTGTSVYEDTITESTSLLDAPNRYIVIDNGMNDLPISGFWDIPDSAPHSIASRGRIITSTHDMQGLVDNGHANQAAKAIGQADRSTYEYASFNTVINPLHDTFDLIEWDIRKFHMQSWRFDCIENGQMSHDLRRVYV